MRKIFCKDKQEKILLDSINNVLYELSNIRKLFEITSDPKLIDYTIYMEEALKCKYMYLLKEAKAKGIKVEYLNNIKQIDVG